MIVNNDKENTHVGCLATWCNLDTVPVCVVHPVSQKSRYIPDTDITMFALF